MATTGVLKRLIAASAKETWKLRHDCAMRECDGFPRVLDDCLRNYRLIGQLDEAWNAEVASGAIDHVEADEIEIDEYFHDWLSGAEEIEKELDSYLKAGIPFPQAEEFRRCLAEARAMLTDDYLLFDSDELASLRDAAIDAHRRGESIEMAEFGD